MNYLSIGFFSFFLAQHFIWQNKSVERLMVDLSKYFVHLNPTPFLQWLQAHIYW